MKFLTIAFLSALSFSSLAQVDIETDNVSIRIAGRGAYVCSAENSLKSRVVLARGESRAEAKVLAQQECEILGDGFFCDVKECEKDVVNGSIVEVAVDISRGQTSVDLSFKGKVKFQCRVEAWGKTYYAKAPTRVEAKVLTQNECAAGNDGSGFFCRVSESDCSQISGNSGRVRVGGLIKDLLN